LRPPMYASGCVPGAHLARPYKHFYPAWSEQGKNIGKGNEGNSQKITAGGRTALRNEQEFVN